MTKKEQRRATHEEKVEHKKWERDWKRKLEAWTEHLRENSWLRRRERGEA